MKINKNEAYNTVIKWLCIILGMLILFALNSCSDSKKLIRLQKRAPYLFSHTVDTLEIVNELPIIIPSFKTDTNGVLIPLKYTFMYENKRAKVEIERTAADSFNVDLIAKEFDTIIFQTLYVPYPVYTPNTQVKNNDLLIFSVVGGFILLLITYIFSLRNKYK